MTGTTQTVHRYETFVPLLLMSLALGSTLMLVVIDATPFATHFAYALYLVPGLMIVWAVIGLWSIALYIRFARRRSWKQSFVPGVLMEVSILVAFNFFTLVRGCNYLGGALRFAITRSYYDQQVALLPADDIPRLAVFSWGGMIWSSRGLVYDESDEIAMPPGQQSARWKDKTRGSELSCGNWDARSLWAHYYLVAFSC